MYQVHINLVNAAKYKFTQIYLIIINAKKQILCEGIQHVMLTVDTHSLKQYNFP